MFMSSEHGRSKIRAASEPVQAGSQQHVAHAHPNQPVHGQPATAAAGVLQYATATVH